MLNLIRKKFGLHKSHRIVTALPISQSRKIMMHRNLVHLHYSHEYAYAKSNGADPSELNALNGEWARQVDALDEHEADVITTRLFRTAARLRIATPSRSEYNKSGLRLYWIDIDDGASEALSDTGIRKLTEDIRSELKWRRETRNHWMGYLGAMTGLVGAIAALFTVLHDGAKNDDPPACVISVDSHGATTIAPPVRH